MYRTKELYDQWNINKQEINFKENNKVYINEREIRFIKMWINIWFEENWKRGFIRPVLIIKKVWNLFFTVALTSKWKNNYHFYHKIQTWQFNERNQKHKNSSYIILSQVKVIDKRRLTEKMWYISKGEFLEIKEKLKAMLL